MSRQNLLALRLRENYFLTSLFVELIDRGKRLNSKIFRCTKLIEAQRVFFAVALGQSDHDAQKPPATTHGESQGLTPEQKAKVEQLGKIQKHFGKKMNSPGVELSLREMTRSRAADRTLVRYRLYGTVVPT